MAGKKAKVSNKKRSNQASQKLHNRKIKKKLLKLNAPKKKQPSKQTAALPAVADEVEETVYEDVADMLDSEALQSVLRSQPIDDEDLEEEFERRNMNKPKPKRMRQCLPIKTESGFVQHEVELEDDDNEEEALPRTAAVEQPVSQKEKLQIPVLHTGSTIEAYARRQELLEEKKLEIANAASKFIASPHDNLRSLRRLLEMLDADLYEAPITVRKLTMATLVEIFADVLPTYRIREQQEGVKLKKDTAIVVNYETTLLKYYTIFLQKCEEVLYKYLKPKKGRKPPEQAEEALGLFSLQCMGHLLYSHPYFNYAPNIAKVAVPFLNHRLESARLLCLQSFAKLFKEDKRGAITCHVVKCINRMVKASKSEVRRDVVDVLLHLDIGEIDLEKIKQDEINAQKKTKNALLSRRERKRKKNREVLEQELREVSAEENKQARSKFLTETTESVFSIYFRVLKNFPRSKLMSAVLEGLAKYAHCINLDFFHDLVSVLDQLLKSGDLGDRERLLCVQTVFKILSGHGEALNVDPMRFYSHLYSTLLSVHAGNTSDNLPLSLGCIENVVIRRHKRVSQQRVLAFTKRLCTVSLHQLHNGSLGSLAMLRNVMMTHPKADILMDSDNLGGCGIFMPELEQPEHCNAASTSLWELHLLQRHFHPAVKQYAKHILKGMPTSGEGSLNGEMSKKHPFELIFEFDGSSMAFKPTIPPPNVGKSVVRKNKQMETNNDM